jgi:ribosomal protein S18 acetylase RimI-like enzyme
MTRRWDIRTADARDLGFLQRMLYEAANRPGDARPPPEECINEPHNRRFWVSWPREGDIGVVAVHQGKPIGAAWIRRFSGDELSPIDDPDIPVLAIAVVADYRGMGVGHALLGELMERATDSGYEAINLTTGSFNQAALRLYASNGFEEVARRGDGLRMRARLERRLCAPDDRTP